MKTVKSLISIENHKEFVESYIEEPIGDLENVGVENYYIDFEARV